MLLEVSLLVLAAASALAEPSKARSGLGGLLDGFQRNKRTGNGGGRVLHYPLYKEAINGTIPRRRRTRSSHGPSLDRRQKWNWKHLEDFRGYAYFMEVEIGDPPQIVKLTPDTGSFETWVNPNCANSASAVLCQFNQFYDANKSQLATKKDNYFDISYGSGWAWGDYYEDRFYFRQEDVAIRQKFGVAVDSAYAVAGILGVGYGYGWNMDYLGIVDSLVKYDLINAPVYSVALAGLGAGTSEIVFGGINQAKYSGYLTPIPVWPSVYEQPSDWVLNWVNVTSFGVTRPNGTSKTFHKASATVPQTNVLLDTGVTYSFLPPAQVEAIAAELGAWIEVGEYKVNCTLRDQNGTVNFGFANDRLIIRVRYFDFFLKLQDGTCTLGVQKQPGNDYDSVLGDTFLRGAYVVYDQTTHNVWMGAYKDCGSQVAEVGRSPGDTGGLRGLC